MLARYGRSIIRKYMKRHKIVNNFFELFNIYIGSRKHLIVISVLIVATYFLLLTINADLILHGPVNDSLSWLRATRNLSIFVRPNTETCIVCVQPPIICEMGLEGDALIYFVTSAPKNRKNRKAIRQTWGKQLIPKTIFVVGLTNDSVDMNLIMNEAKLYQDIIIEDFIDSYSNLTLKTGFMMKHFLKMCPNGKYLFKIDDDMLINPGIINDILSNPLYPKDVLIGRLLPSLWPHRDPESKWYIPYWLYGNSQFPIFLNGPSYLIPGKLVAEIYETSMKVPIVPLEDVFYTGIIAKYTLNLTLKDDYRFNMEKPFVDYYCLFQPKATVHHLDPDTLVKVWNDMHKSQDHCKGLKYRLLNFIFG